MSSVQDRSSYWLRPSADPSRSRQRSINCRSKSSVSKQRLGLLQHLQQEYQQKGSAAVYSFSISSNIQVAEDPPAFRDALRAVVKELTDMHRYQVTQKLGGGRLNIQVAEANEPAIAWIEQWLGGALSPMQLRALRARSLTRSAMPREEHMFVTPDEPIVVDGHVRHAEKHLAARFVSDVLQRLDKTESTDTKAALDPRERFAGGHAAFTGTPHRRSGQNDWTRWSFPLTQMVHVYVSGTTGGGNLSWHACLSKKRRSRSN